MAIDSAMDIFLTIILPMIGSAILSPFLIILWRFATKKLIAGLKNALGMTEIAQKLDSLSAEVDSIKKDQSRVRSGATNLRTRIRKLEEAAASPSNPSSGDGSDES